MNESKSAFSATLRKRVAAYFKENNVSMHATPAMITKTVILVLAYLLPFASVMVFNMGTWGLVGMYAIMGFAMAGIGMSIMHDGNHGAYSHNTRVNNWMGYALNMVGGMVYNWKLQHNMLHHNHTNISGIDDDIDDKIICKFSPHSQMKSRWYHKFQHFYAFFFYAIVTLYWVTVKDFLQYARYKGYGINKQSDRKNRVFLINMILLKVVYFGYILVLPVYVGGYSWMAVMGGFVTLHIICGLILTIVFQMAHCVEEATFPKPDENNVIHEDWAIHQMRTTMNFSAHSKIVSWYVGGLNYQIEHHLFPHICHVHYPAISEIVKQTAAEFNVPYLYVPTLGQAFRSHVRLLKKIGYTPNLDLAAM